jgi:beta-glucosidase/6-phospho-beta-glucosidase/beta-galactosidase
MESTRQQTTSLSKDPFLWGVATSPYQSEGGYNGPGWPQTNWATAEERKDVVKTGVASDFWNQYEEDFRRCRALGLNAFRLGIEWSRVQPTLRNEPGAMPGFDAAALDHYAAIFAACRNHGMEPVVTLHHFVHPAWLGTDPWLNPETPEIFAAYARYAVAWVNRKLTVEHRMAPLKYFITINEPNMLVLNTYFGNQFPSKGGLGFGAMTRAYNGLLTAHILAYNTLHDLHAAENWPEPLVSINNYCSDLYWSDKLLLDLLCLAERGVPRGGAKAYIHGKILEFESAFREARIPLHKDLPYYFGALIKRFSNWLGYRNFDPAHFQVLLDAVYGSPRKRLFDYVGLDYYDPFAAHAFRLPVLWDHEFKSKSLRSWIMNTITSKWWDWRVLPLGLHFFCKYYTQDFGRPALIAENGMAIRRRANQSHTRRRDRMTRSQFLRLHVHEVVKTAGEGIPLLGYLHWSLFDNYEWGTFTPRFGLFSIDYKQGTQRLVEDESGDRPSETYAALIREAREKAPVSQG